MKSIHQNRHEGLPANSRTSGVDDRQNPMSFGRARHFKRPALLVLFLSAVFLIYITVLQQMPLTAGPATPKLANFDTKDSCNCPTSQALPKDDQPVPSTPALQKEAKLTPEEKTQLSLSTLRETYVTQYFNNINTGNNQGIGKGAMDTDVLITSISVVYEEILREKKLRGKYAVFIDIGANIGRTSTLILDRVTDVHCDRSPIGAHGYSCIDNELVIAFEPDRENFDYIKKIGDRNNWLGTWVALDAAVTDKDSNVVFVSNGGGDEQGAISFRPDATGERKVRGATLDSLFKHGLNWRGDSNDLIVPSAHGNTARFEDIVKTGDYDMILLKVDTEGFDYFVLRGAKEILKEKKPLFVIAEYNSKWFNQGRTTTLREVQQEMLDLGYRCGFITADDVVPFYGELWSDKYEIRDWSNFFCAVSGNKYVDRLIKIFNRNIHLDQW